MLQRAGALGRVLGSRAPAWPPPCGGLLTRPTATAAPPQAGETAALQAFTEQFSGAQFRKGLEITFTTRGAQLQTRVDGEQVRAAR